MKAMILAAGRGERMKPLTDTCPKPLLTAAGKPLIVYHIEKLAKVGITDIVINHAWLGEQLVEFLGDGNKWGVTINYSAETSGALETAGGINKALSLLNPELTNDPFLVINGDIYIDYDFTKLPQLSEGEVGHLLLTQNPVHNPQGDFGIKNGMLVNHAELMSTFCGIALYRPSFFNHVDKEQVEKLAPLIRAAADKQLIGASMLPGKWVDVGTPERLEQLEHYIQTKEQSGQ